MRALVFRLSALAVLAVSPLAAQGPAAPVRDSIMVPIRQLFDGMRAHDSAAVRAAFVPGAQFSRPPMPGQAHRYTTLDQFVQAVGRPGVPWDEQIFDPEIREDGGMATVWTFFTFSLGDRLSHCGVNAFQVIRTDAGWRIAGLADSNRRTGCETTGRARVQ
jgi:hypothetical protein